MTASTRAFRLGVRSVGELMITVGLVVILFTVYQLAWTNWEAGRAHGRVTQEIRESWQRPPPSPAVGDTAPEGRTQPGRGFAILRIPRLGRDYAVPILEGVALKVLARGVGHYPGTEMPGELGNFAIAGHRATNGEPFANLDRLRRLDRIIVETRGDVYTYVVQRIRIVRPDATWVIDPVPGRKGVQPRQRLITVTTCNPRWGSTERLIVWGRLDEALPKTSVSDV